MRADLARALAAGFLAGEWTQPGLVASGADVVGARKRWLHPLARQVLAAYPRPPLDEPRRLASLIADLPAAYSAGPVGPAATPLVATRMIRNPWHLPELHGLDDLGRLLELTQSELDWYADPRHWARTTGGVRLQHYRVSSRVSASGAIRVLEAPKLELKRIQRLLLDRVIGGIPPHDAAHGFRPGRSAGSYAAPHAGQRVLVRLDLEGFFASVSVGRVFGIFRAAGYPEPVAYCLAGLVTTVLPLRQWQQIPRPADAGLHSAHWRLGRRLALPHLPQGAPTSPALANLAAWYLDIRLSALAATWGGQYTRYADDLAFSGGAGWRTGTSRLLDVIEVIVREEGFRLNARKTAVLPRSGRQDLAGLVVNTRPRPSRAQIDQLRAVLHNCGVHGPSTQNRADHPHFRDHLRGRVSWVAQHDSRVGDRLLATFEAIDWER